MEEILRQCTYALILDSLRDMPVEHAVSALQQMPDFYRSRLLSYLEDDLRNAFLTEESRPGSEAALQRFLTALSDNGFVGSFSVGPTSFTPAELKIQTLASSISSIDSHQNTLSCVAFLKEAANHLRQNGLVSLESAALGPTGLKEPLGIHLLMSVTSGWPIPSLRRTDFQPTAVFQKVLWLGSRLLQHGESATTVERFCSCLARPDGNFA